MSKTQIGKIDEKGRLLIPAAFREVLNINENSNVLLMLDSENGRVSVLPYATAGSSLHKLVIELSDTPGSLSRIMALLAKNGADFVQHDCAASERGKCAILHSVVDLSKSRMSASEIKSALLREKLASHVEISDA